MSKFNWQHPRGLYGGGGLWREPPGSVPELSYAEEQAAKARDLARNAKRLADDEETSRRALMAQQEREATIPVTNAAVFSMNLLRDRDYRVNEAEFDFHRAVLAFSCEYYPGAIKQTNSARRAESLRARLSQCADALKRLEEAGATS